ncbi:hypothetical protein, partial [Desertifilum sp. FACHB-1129]|uniref:hypothetical protein n=1 Tax=Desertifilum sp. FACHB-1129 TaxID=2692795 RepID=UPI001A7E2645
VTLALTQPTTFFHDLSIDFLPVNLNKFVLFLCLTDNQDSHVGWVEVRNPTKLWLLLGYASANPTYYFQQFCQSIPLFLLLGGYHVYTANA